MLYKLTFYLLLLTYLLRSVCNVCEQQACYEEQVYHVGKDLTQPLDYDALKECTLLERCIKETLRLRPPLVTIMRMCKTPQVITTITTTTNSIVVFTEGLQRLPKDIEGY